MAVAKRRRSRVAPTSYSRPFERGLTWGHKEQGSVKRPYPNRSSTVHQNGRRKTTRVSMLCANLLTHRSTQCKRPPEACSHREPSRSSATPSICKTGVHRRSVKVVRSQLSRTEALPLGSARRLRSRRLRQSRYCGQLRWWLLRRIGNASVKAKDPGRGSEPEVFVGGLLDINDGPSPLSRSTYRDGSLRLSNRRRPGCRSAHGIYGVSMQCRSGRPFGLLEESTHKAT